ncbi:uncharacterized protein N7525_009409 [Penicillium rubens]|uniref:uncharacterized protein n=1 Tax=Penicillium rubens TaxID=1108849 RepID=UPI002A5AFC29|nr:uncharacterized protein N7525_009409 [Penicillium rubens]KAJ5831156.1 hypothetical protein N7525_009409 [Penicillium rubens]KAJ5854704.1 hypothetical protein N7534_007247 [Penicillium rubens]
MLARIPRYGGITLRAYSTEGLITLGKSGETLEFFLAMLALLYLRDRVNTAQGHANIVGQNTSRGSYNTSRASIRRDGMDTGVLFNALTNLNLMSRKVDLTPTDNQLVQRIPRTSLGHSLKRWTPEGNYRRTQLALTKVYDLIEQRYMSFMDVAGVGPFLPISVTREERKNFVFTKREDNGISTHLNLNVNQNSPEKEVAAADMAPHKSGNFNEKIIGEWPGSLNHLEYLMGPRLQDSKFTYRTTNGFTNVGKGISLLEKQKGRSP